MQGRRLGLAAGLGLVALVPLLLASTAVAAPPLAQPWTADLAGNPVNAGNALALAFDQGGTQLLVGTADRGQQGGDNDLVHVRFDLGNATAEVDGDSGLGTAEGKAAVAISPEGKYAVAVGNYTAQGLLPEGSGANVFYYALPDMTATWRKFRAEPVTHAVIAGADGDVVVIGTRNTSAAPQGRIVRYDKDGDQVWDRSAASCGGETGTGGAVLSMDLSRDGKWLVVGTVFGTVEGPKGCVQLFDSAAITPVMAYKVPSVNAGDVTAVDVSANGQWLAAGTASGGLYAWANTPAGRASPVSAQLPALAAVRAVRLTEDGSALVAADATTVARYARGAELTLEWSAAVPGLRSLDATPDGEYIVAGAAQLLAFHRSGNATLWAVDLGDALVRVAHPGANDIRIAAASGSQVRGYRLHWALEARKAEPEPVPVSLGQARPYTVEVLNAGSAVDNFLLSGSAQGFQVDLNPAALSLRPGELANTTVTFTPAPGAEAGLYRIQVRAEGERSRVTQVITVNATVGAVPRLGLGLADRSYGDRAVFQGEEHSIVFEVRNSGNARLEVAYDLTQQPNVGPAWEASLARTSGVVEAGGVTSNTLALVVPFDARNGTENFFNVTVRGEGAAASASFRLVVNPQFTAGIDVVPQSKVVAPGKSVAYSVVVANNGTLRETYKLVYCVALPDLIPCVGNATTGLGGWSVALDTTPFTLDHDQSKSFQLAVGAPRGAIPNVDKLALQVEVYSENPEHVFRDTRVVITSVQEDVAPPPRPAFTPGFEAMGILAALGCALLLRRLAAR